MAGPAGRTPTALEPGGVVRRFEYDRLGRTVRDSGTGADRAAERTFGYDAAGRLTGTVSGNATTMYEYDDRGLLTTASGPVIGRTVYTYDDDGRVTNRVGPSAVDGVGWSYDKSDLAVVHDTMSGVTRGYTHDPAGRITGEEQKRGNTPLATRSYTYDATGRLDTDTVRNPAGAVTAKQSFRWDLQGNLIGTKTEGDLAGTRSQDFTYDVAGRLTGDYDPAAGTGTDYAWDAVGNRTAATKWEGTPDHHTATGGSTFTYDERNRITQASDPGGGTTDYTWRATGTLASTTNHTVGKPDVTSTQTFDAFARLIGDGTSTYTSDALDRLTSERNPVTGSAHSFGYTGFDKEPATDGRWWFSRAGNTVLGARDGNPDVTFSAGSPGGTAETLADPGTAPTYGVLANAHHDVVALTDSTTGAVAGSRAFDPFGRITASTGALSPLGFQGSWTDESTGRVQAQARWYDPKTGSFASGDTASVPFGGAASTNRYTYAEGNPTSRWDPSGHFRGIDLGFDLQDVYHRQFRCLGNRRRHRSSSRLSPKLLSCPRSCLTTCGVKGRTALRDAATRVDIRRQGAIAGPLRVVHIDHDPYLGAQWRAFGFADGSRRGRGCAVTERCRRRSGVRLASTTCVGLGSMIAAKDEPAWSICSVGSMARSTGKPWLLHGCDRTPATLLRFLRPCPRHLGSTTGAGRSARSLPWIAGDGCSAGRTSRDRCPLALFYFRDPLADAEGAGKTSSDGWTGSSAFRPVVHA